MLKLIIIEEHHEAFIGWHWAVQQGYVDQVGCHLLHVDHHADLGPAYLYSDPPSFTDPLSDSIAFTYQSLGIAGFIIPAIWNGFISNVTWLQHFRPISCCKLEVKSITNSRHITLYKRLHQLVSLGLPMHHHQTEPTHSARLWTVDHRNRHTKGGALLLDIDLDYFSCAKDPWTALAGQTLEITKAAYDEVEANPYHFMKLNCGQFEYDYDEAEGKYLIRVRDSPSPHNTQETLALVRKRVDGLREYLVTNEIVPSLITICRSRFSGFTPTNHWEQIERTVLDMLSPIYNPEITNIGSIVERGN